MNERGFAGVRAPAVDRVWRGMTEPVPPPPDSSVPHLIQVIAFGEAWAYPIYLDGDVTRVLPEGGAHPTTVKANGVPRLDLESA